MNILIAIALAILFCHIVARPPRRDPTLGGRIVSRRHDVVISNKQIAQNREIVARELDLIEAYETLRYRKECAKRRERFERELQ